MNMMDTYQQPVDWEARAIAAEDSLRKVQERLSAKEKDLEIQNKLYARIAIGYWEALHQAVGIKVDSGLLTRLDELMKERNKK